jgi:hypothetical protein
MDIPPFGANGIEFNNAKDSIANGRWGLNNESPSDCMATMWYLRKRLNRRKTTARN